VSGAKFESPQRLKPNSKAPDNGTAEAVPLQSLLLQLPKRANNSAQHRSTIACWIQLL
jgi:hypothetical protein